MKITTLCCSVKEQFAFCIACIRRMSELLTQLLTNKLQSLVKRHSDKHTLALEHTLDS